MMDLFDVSPFVNVTVDQLIFSGYQAPMINKVVNKLVWFVNNLIGIKLLNETAPQYVLLNSENATTDQLYHVWTGKSDRQKTGFILRWDNMTNASLPSEGNSLPESWWPGFNATWCEKGKSALKLDGTNGDYFQNFIKKTDRLPVFIYDLCRTSYLTYDRDVTVEGIPGYRFVLPADEFNTTNPDNCGFCNPLKYGAYETPKDARCMPTGLLDLSNCQNGAPIMLSKPHFYQAEPVVSRFVPRFKPNYDADETMLDLEPYTGTVLAAQKRSQINVLVNQLVHINAYKVLRPGAYPLVWSNESFYMDEGTKSQLNQIYVPKKIVTIVCWCVFGLGVLFFLVGAIVLIGTVVQVERKRK
ncbi:hypothetical protein WR25_14752 isoform A [Diploscapter pachys]|uniref:CD36 family protein n=2 Tax=Diploscapter pachys TaxID=2018661 RepID=A0A2A2LBP6_9BILA|nr:hypothetical protein WR25_14752 isoform A [Diploscapter pachys]